MYSLQNVPNRAAKVVFARGDMSIVRPLPKALHWLPVKDRITFRDSRFFFPFFFFFLLNGILPPYLSSVLSVYTPSRKVHSS